MEIEIKKKEFEKEVKICKYNEFQKNIIHFILIFLVMLNQYFK